MDSVCLRRESQARSPILYQNHSRTVILMDIPTSIAQAQATLGCPSFDALLSCEPVRQPYASTEPKTEAARARLMERADPEALALHAHISKQIQDALLEIRLVHKGDWCLPRRPSPIRGHGRKLQKGNPVKDGAPYVALVEAFRERPSEPDSGLCDEIASQPCNALLPPLQLTATDDGISSRHTEMLYIQDCVVRNDYNTPITMNIDSLRQLRIPPLSTFISSPIESSVEIFINAADKYLCRTSLSDSEQFDFILADPPWLNRSVRRSKKYKTLGYHSSDPWETIQGILGQHLAPGGLVGVWVTNKAEPRKKVLTAFQHWNVQLVEEWVWMKTTLHGELVTELDGLWRRPYEILLLGRKSLSHDCESRTADDSSLNRRFICGVPDLHSRKPSLKELIEPLMPDRCSYRAIELFARNLTAGWWSWGDEVLKFNWEDNWVKGGLRSTTQG